jgi:hypothetical protein
MKFLGAVSARPESAVVKVNNIDITAVAGDVVVVAITGENAEANGAGEEYVYDGEKWILIGDENTISTLSTDIEKLRTDLNNGNYSLKLNTI